MRPPVFHSEKHLKDVRAGLRNNATPAEAALWNLLKGSQLDGRKFRRQHSIGNYVLDFWCPRERLAIELDGAEHFTSYGAEADEVRDAFLRECEVRVLRIENHLVFDEPEAVLAMIRAAYFPL